MKVEIKVELPSNEKEKQLAKIWADTLSIDVKKIGRQTSFFEVGGDSINSIQLISRCKSIGLKLDTASIFKKSTLAQMATLIGKTVERDVVIKPIIVS